MGKLPTIVVCATVTEPWRTAAPFRVMLVIFVAPVGPKFVPVMVTKPPLVAGADTAVMVGLEYLNSVLAALVRVCVSRVSFTRTLLDAPVPAGAVHLISVLAVDTVTAVQGFPSTVTEAKELPAGPNDVPAMVISAPAELTPTVGVTPLTVGVVTASFPAPVVPESRTASNSLTTTLVLMATPSAIVHLIFVLAVVTSGLLQAISAEHAALAQSWTFALG